MEPATHPDGVQPVPVHGEVIQHIRRRSLVDALQRLASSHLRPRGKVALRGAGIVSGGRLEARSDVPGEEEEVNRVLDAAQSFVLCL